MKYAVKKRNVVQWLSGWCGIVAFGIINIGIIWGCWMDPNLATGPVIALFVCLCVMIIFWGFFVLHAIRPKIVVKGDVISIYDFLKKKKEISLKRINGRFCAPYTEKSSERQLRTALNGVPGRQIIAKVIASSESWKSHEMVKVTYYANGIEAFSIHTGMKNALQLDAQIIASLENHWGYVYDGNSVTGQVPISEKVQVSTANLHRFIDEKTAEEYLKTMIVVEGPIKGMTIIGFVGFLLFLIDNYKTHFVSNEITTYMLFFFGAMSLVALCIWLAMAHTKSKSIQLLKSRQEIILAADQLYALDGLGRKDNKLKITPNFVFSNHTSAIVPLDEIIWVYVKNNEYANEVCTGLKDGRILTIGRYKVNSGAEASVPYNILYEYLGQKQILWGYSPQHQAIYDKVTKRKK